MAPPSGRRPPESGDRQPELPVALPVARDIVDEGEEAAKGGLLPHPGSPKCSIQLWIPLPKQPQSSKQTLVIGSVKKPAQGSRQDHEADDGNAYRNEQTIDEHAQQSSGSRLGQEALTIDSAPLAEPILDFRRDDVSIFGVLPSEGHGDGEGIW